MYVIQDKTSCEECGGAGTVYDEDPEPPSGYQTVPCLRCNNGTVIREVDADQWLVQRLKKLCVKSWVPTALGPRQQVSYPLENVTLEDCD